MCAGFDNKITSWKAAVEQQENIQVSALKQKQKKKEKYRYHMVMLRYTELPQATLRL